MIDKILEYKDELGSNTLKSLAAFALDPKNIQRLKDNPKLVKTLTNNKLLPSSIRLYIRNIAGVTDKITEDFFSKSELAEIKDRVAKAEAQRSKGNKANYGLVADSRVDNVIGYKSRDGKLSLSKAFTSPETNIDQTLGQASFSKDEKGNYTIKDTHNFDGDPVGGSTMYDNAIYFKRQEDNPNLKAIPHLDTAEKIDKMLFDYMDKPGESKNERESKKWITDLYKKDGLWGNYKENSTAVTYEQSETNEELLRRAYKAHATGDIDSIQLARILGKLEGTDIPVELGIGSITQEDKYKADPDFARYIAGDTIMGDEYDFAGAGKSYEDVGIPSLIRNNARKFIK
jgi:hypothetical protein